MPIQVTCPNCLKRFKVSDKFAGKTGPCPNCEKPIKIPDKGEEIVIHAPDDSGPKDSKGRPVLKPLKRRETRISRPVLLSSISGAILVLFVAVAIRLTGQTPPTALLAVSSLALAPPIIMVSYWALLSDEIEGFGWRELVVRALICSVVFAGLWALYAYLPRYLADRHSMAEITGLELAVYVPLMIAIGAATATIVMELEATQGMLLYLFYFAITFLLAWVSGVPMARPFADPTTLPEEIRATPDVGGSEGEGTPPPKVPKLLQ